MTTETADPVGAVGAVAQATEAGFLQRHGATIEYVLIPGAALVGALAVFGIFVALFGKNPLDLYFYMYQGAFGTWFSWQNTLTRAGSAVHSAVRMRGAARVSVFCQEKAVPNAPWYM